jgi:conjugal transfer pilus assembly protein TraW
VNCKFFFLLTAIFIVWSANQAFGMIKNLGVVGETYPIAESDVVAELKEEAARKNHFGDDEFLERMKTYQPENLHHLPRATRDRTFLVDMTYTLDRDLLDGDGKVIYPRGFTFNPLDYVSFSGGMLVIDGSDPTQVKWFTKTPYVNNHRVRLLLSGGYAYNLIEELKRSVFYLTDEIAGRLHLSAAPALIIQKGDRLQVREFLVPEGEHDEK